MGLEEITSLIAGAGDGFSDHFHKSLTMSIIKVIIDGRSSNNFDQFSLDVVDANYTVSSITVRPELDKEAAPSANTRIDWKETPQAHVFKADLPGLKKEEVKVVVEDGRVLQISGERGKEKEEKNDTWHRMERSSEYLRRLRLPENAKVDQVKASLENGVLAVTVPKEQIKRPQVKSVEISEGSDQATDDSDYDIPKRPSSPFFVFMESFRESYMKEHPNNKFVSVVAKAGGDKWRAMTEAEKAPFVAKAERRKADYDNHLMAYNSNTKKPKEKESSDKEEFSKSRSKVHDDEEDDEDESEEEKAPFVAEADTYYKCLMAYNSNEEESEEDY